MKVLTQLRHNYKSFMWNVNRFLYKVEVHVYPTSPYFPATTLVNVVLVDQFSYRLEYLLVPMDENGKVDVQPVFERHVGLHRLKIHYPENWDQQMDHFKARLNKEQGKPLKRESRK